METHTGIELCSFGKETILPHLEHTAYTHTHLLNDLACPSTTCDPTLLSSIPRGSEGWIKVSRRAGTFRVSPGEAFVWDSDGWVPGCVAASQGMHSCLPCMLSPHCSPNGRLICPAFSSTGHTDLLSSVSWGDLRTAGSWDLCCLSSSWDFA